MDKLKEAEGILKKGKQLIAKRKGEIKNLLNRPEVTGWKAVPFEKVSKAIKALGMPDKEIYGAINALPGEAKKIAQLLAKHENEIGNQLADLIGHQNPDKALLDAQALDKKIQNLDKDQSQFNHLTTLLIGSDRTLRQKLNVESVLPLAKERSGHKKSLFEEGLEILRVLIEIPESTVTEETMTKSLAMAEKIEARFNKLDFPGLPRLTAEILYHLIGRCISTLHIVAAFGSALTDRLLAEENSIALIHQNLQTLLKESQKNIIIGISKQADTLGAIVTSFYHKKEIKSFTDAAWANLEYLNVLHLTLKNHTALFLQDETAKSDSPINPSYIAAKNTKNFFFGPKGVLRSVKMLLKSLKGAEGVNELELQVILENAIKNCRIFYGTTQNDIAKLDQFIDSFIKHYPKPFPYEELRALIKKTIAGFGASAEQIVYASPIEEQYRTVSPLKVPKKIGKLMEKINARNELLKNVKL